MLDFATLTAAQVLAIPEGYPEKLFSGPDLVEQEYRKAAKRLHPDAKPYGDHAVFQRLNILHQDAKAKIGRGEWLTPGLVILKGEDGTERRIRFRRDFDVSVGHAYLGQSLVTYVLSPDLADMGENARKVITGMEKLTYPSDKVRRDIEHRRPRLKTSFRTQDGKTVLVIEKPNHVVRLRDVLDHVGGKLDPRHVAWLMSELHNLGCWLEHAKLTHNDISLDSVFISPAKHTAMILGGWWFSALEGARMQRVQAARTIGNAPRSVLDTKLASIRTDLGQIRLLGRELLGDEGGANLIKDKTVHPVLANWLRLATTGKARDDYRQWQTALTGAFGDRRFTPLDLSFNDLYKE